MDSALLTLLQTAVGTALPVIVQDLSGDKFVWVGSAYTLGSTALIPFCGGLAQVGLLRLDQSVLNHRRYSVEEL